MADFPALAPVSRRYSFGVLPVSEEAGFGGGAVRFLHSTQRSGVTLELGYELLTQAEAQLIRDHYRGQQGGTLAFALGSTAWAGHTAQDDLVPTGTQWCWVSPPEEEQQRGGRVRVTCQLRSVAGLS